MKIMSKGFNFEFLIILHSEFEHFQFLRNFPRTRLFLFHIFNTDKYMHSLSAYYIPYSKFALKDHRILVHYPIKSYFYANYRTDACQRELGNFS